MTTPLATTALDGPQLRDAFAAAAAHLKDAEKAVDAINVYPVPDGDTGSNMAATLREAVDSTAILAEPVTVTAVLQALAKGALYGARGNSGVILSQALKGLAEGVGQVEQFDAAALARGLAGASEFAYRSVSKPVEGTMLTVVRRAAEEATQHAQRMPDGGEGMPCLPVLATAVSAAETAEEETPSQLKELADAGVTDAGGEGICVILRGLLAYITGRTPPPPSMPEKPIAMMAGHEAEEYGFCTEFVLEAPEGGEVDVEAVREFADASGRSVVVVGDSRAARVHLHSDEPEGVIERAAQFGTVQRPKVDDMTAQNIRFQEGGSGATAKLAVLALSRGAGLNRVFVGLGAAITDLGEVVKPPAGEIARAADALGKADVILLPNHKNIVPAAEQAAGLARCTVHVLGTENLLQGIAAAVELNLEASLQENLAAMEEARSAVRAVEVTIAAANRSADGVEAREGEAIALVDGRLVDSKPSLVEALLSGLRRAGADEAGLITVYCGAETGEEEWEPLRTAVTEAFPSTELEVVDGGQPLYPLLASVER